jgi:glycosyltransferase involved in cell wall biosynthesis
LGRQLGKRGLEGRIWTALRMPELVGLRHGAVRTLLDEVDHVIALCGWTKEVLLRNGVPPEKVTLSRHGVCHSPERVRTSLRPRAELQVPIRIAYLGRLESEKGVDLLIDAMLCLQERQLTLDIFGLNHGSQEHPYANRLRALASRDTRIRFCPELRGHEVLNRLAEYHCLAVPSRSLETGPMVVLEAFAAGIPVIVSDAGGIAELVSHEQNGLLVSPNVKAWKKILLRISDDPAVLQKLRAGVRPPRTIRDAASEVQAVYDSVTCHVAHPIR